MIPIVIRSLAAGRSAVPKADEVMTYGAAAAVRLTAGDDRVIVEIDDLGPGIPEAEMEKVFAPFYRIEGSRSRETGGTGLGLAVVRSVVAAQAGDVTLSNRPEGGLRVTVTLPRTVLTA